jgi:predicted DNA-binding transcriptional regulator YafY
MRADRLLAILLLLQRGGRMTAGELARRLEVSERTIYRDLEALGAAGVPVYAEPGRGGGIRLVEGYRTDLSGLSLSEAELVPLLGLSGAFAGIALGSSLRRTETKLLMALGEDQRHRAEVAQKRIHVDLQRWWDHAEPVPHLAAVADAVLGARRLRITYRRGQDASEVRRKLEPLGLVVQGGTWYLVASAGRGEPRIYRISRIADVEALDETFDAPEGFDLETFWSGRKEEFHMTRPGYRVRLRARGHALRALRGGQWWDAVVEELEDADGWATVTVSVETKWTARDRMLALGAGAEVLEPPELRQMVVDALAGMGAIYANDSATAMPAHGERPSGS